MSMIRLANSGGGTVWTSPPFTWPDNTGTSWDEVLLNHNLGTHEYSVQIFDTNLESGYHLQHADLNRDTGNSTFGMHRYCGTNTLRLLLYRHAFGSARNYYAVLKTFQ